MNKQWWQNAIIYQIYPKSFKDSNHDGIGDIQGMIEKLDYLQSLGVNAIWLNPIFSSPQVDNGYDIDNYMKIDPIFGSMSDVERLIDEAHQRGMKVIFDFVLNHTSNQHAWFKEALRDKKSPYRDYYYFVDEKPNNWGSFFGGSVWEQTEDEDYYFHLFAKEMPDLNWQNPNVRRDMLEIARYWVKKGIDGLRLDAFIHLGKANFSQQQEPVDEDPVIAEQYYANLPLVHQYMKEFSETLKEEFPHLFLVGEASSSDVQTAIDYMSPDSHECDSVITFRYFEEQDDPEYPELPTRFQRKTMAWSQFASIMDEWQEKMGAVGFPTLYWNNHDMARLVNRFGDIDERDASQKCLATLMYLQKGIPVLLYGEEIGMKNYHATSIDDIEEAEGREFYEEALAYGLSEAEVLHMMENHTRNASRGSMQWTSGSYAGFSDHAPWLGVNVEEKYNVEAEQQDESSILHYYQALLRLKQEDVWTYGQYTRLSHPTLYAYTRQDSDKVATVYCNLTESPQTVEKRGTVRLAQNVSEDDQHYTLQPWGSLVIEEETK